MTNGQYWFLKKLLIVWGRYRLVSFLSLNAFAIIILLVSKGLCCYCRLGWVSSRKSCINRPDPDSEPDLTHTFLRSWKKKFVSSGIDVSDLHLWVSHLAKERGGGEGGHQGGQEHHLHPHRCAVACPEICDDQREMKMFFNLSLRMFLWMFTRMFWTCPWECHRKAFQCSWRQSSPLRQKTGNDRPR